MKDWLATFKYHGDILALYNSNNQLVYDQFIDNGSCNIRLSYVLKDNKNITAQVLPMKPESDIYVEDDYEQARIKDWTKAAIKKIELMPIYQYRLIIK